MDLKTCAMGCCMSNDTAKLLLRLSVGILVLLHGIAKLMHPEMMGFIAGAFQSAHLPGFLAYLVYVGEIVAPIMVIVGYQTRLGAKLIAATLAIAILLVHLPQLFMLGQMGGSALEVQYMFLFGAIAIAGLGAGKYSLDAKKSAATMM